MTHYLGSKARHADEITGITLATRRPGQAYVEPFVGGGNVICRVPQSMGRRIANDLNPYMAALLDALGNRDWQPPETMTEPEWRKIMRWATAKDPKLENRPPDEKALFAFSATGPTFGSMWCGPWAKDDPAGTRYRQARENCLRDAPGLKGVEFHHGQYFDLEFPPESLIYCDPPYSDTTGYEGAAQKIAVGESAGKNNWSAKKFWQWCDARVDAGCTVFVSEYKGPASDVYQPDQPTFGEKADLKALVEQCKAKQQDRSCPGEEVSAAVDLCHRLSDRLKVKGIQEKLDRWKLVWEKEVAVNIAAQSINTAAGETAVRKTERLFSRAP